MIIEFRNHFKGKFSRYKTSLESERKSVRSLIDNRGHNDIAEYYKILNLLKRDLFWGDKCRSLGKLLKQTRDKSQYEFDRLLDKSGEPNRSPDGRIAINQPYTILEDRMI